MPSSPSCSPDLPLLGNYASILPDLYVLQHSPWIYHLLCKSCHDLSYKSATHLSQLLPLDIPWPVFLTDLKLIVNLVVLPHFSIFLSHSGKTNIICSFTHAMHLVAVLLIPMNGCGKTFTKPENNISLSLIPLLIPSKLCTHADVFLRISA